MSNEVLEISVSIDEHFDINFNLTAGFLNSIFKIFSI
ncbi:MAG: phenylalanyl-tRNA synthetase subunit alpha [Bacteroidota bacterium]